MTFSDLVRKVSELSGEVHRLKQELQRRRTGAEWSAGCTKSLEKSTMTRGSRLSLPAERHNYSSTVKPKSATGGNSETSVRVAAAKTSASVPRETSSSQVVGSNQSLQSTACPVSEVSPHPGRCSPKPTYSAVLEQEASIAPKADTKEDAPPKKPTRTAPPLGGTVRKHNKEKFDLKESEQSELIQVDRNFTKGKIPRKVKKHHKESGVNLSTSEDLTFHLRTEFAFVPRNSDIFRPMTIKAKAFLRNFDLSMLTAEQVHKMIMSSVRAAIPITPEEQATRASLKNKDVIEEIVKQGALVEDGVVGNEGTLNIFKGFKSKFTLPPKNKNKC